MILFFYRFESLKKKSVVVEKFGKNYAEEC